MYSENIIFFDGEFTSLDPQTGRLLSLALVRQDGSSLYLELKVGDTPLHPWVQENVVPYLQGNAVADEEAVRRVREFVGDGLPYLVAKVNQFDWIFLAKLLGLMKRGEETVFYWIPIDFATILFARDIDPALPSDQLAARLGIEVPADFVNHHALSDAQLLRLLYQKLVA